MLARFTNESGNVSRSNTYYDIPRLGENSYSVSSNREVHSATVFSTYDCHSDGLSRHNSIYFASHSRCSTQPSFIGVMSKSI
jgi:hypothetical protein